MRALAAALLLGLVAACTQDPPGTCASDSECNAGTICSNGVCAGCDSSADCHAWQGCNVGAHACAPLAGRCNGGADCAAWELCDGTHTCVLAPGRCYSEADCASFESCTNHACTLRPGRCYAASDCSGFWPACSANACESAPPGGSDVVIEGMAGGGEAVATVLEPTRAFVAFGGTVQQASFVNPKGWITYSDATLSPERLRDFVPDAWKSGVPFSQAYPIDGVENDPQYSTTACAPTDRVLYFVLQEGTGELVYACGNLYGGSVTPVFYDRDGNAISPGTWIRAWNAAGHMLGLEPGTPKSWSVLGADGVKRAVTGLPYDPWDYDERADGDGFWFVSGSAWGGPAELYRIDPDGVASSLGWYAPKPASVSMGFAYGTQVVDKTGAIYATDYTADSNTYDVIVKYPAGGGTPVIVYSEANRPPNANSSPGTLFIGLPGRLLRGP
jgi:hypothetical protein